MLPIGSAAPGQLVVRCAWCDRVRADGDWIEAAPGSHAADDTSHSICCDCTTWLRERGFSS